MLAKRNACVLVRTLSKPLRKEQHINLVSREVTLVGIIIETAEH